jgi:hypothetical protein
MSEWWTYRLGDFLLFSPRVYWRMFELHNAEFWPLHVLTLASGLVIALLMRRRSPLWIALILAGLWMFVGWLFLWNRYAAINWAIAYVAPAFGFEALLLAIAAGWGGLTFAKSDLTARVGWLIAIMGLAVYPILPLLFGRSWTAAETFGIAPDPTAMVTIGVLLSASGRYQLALMPIPLAWLLLSGLTLGTMGDLQVWIPLLVAAAAVMAMALRLARAPPATQARSGHHRR